MTDIKAENINESSKWTVYIVRCADKSLYTGITTNIERRIDEHNDNSTTSKAAKYTRARQPVTLVHAEQASNRAEASRREYQIKKMTREEKLTLCKN